jgi:hypothetical protein
LQPELGAFRKWWQGQPLLKGAEQYALGNLRNIGQLTSPLMDVYRSQLQPILSTGGALTPEMQRTAEQAALQEQSAAGMAHTNQAIASQLLNREQYRQQRFNTALQQAMGITSGIQGLQSGQLNQAIGTEQGMVSPFVQLASPIIGYGQDYFNTLYNAQAAQNISGGNKSSGLMGGGLSAIGSIGGGIAMGAL